MTALVRRFHEETGQLACDYPTPPSADTIRHRLRLINEEHKEVKDDLEKLLHARGWEAQMDVMRALLKELADLRYVLEGTAVSLGLPMDEAYAMVHISNMSKRFPDGTFHVDDGGKVLKGPNYQPPEMDRLVPGTIEGTVDSEESRSMHVGNRLRIDLGDGIVVG